MQTLRSSAEFARVRAEGRRASGKLFALSHAPRADAGPARFGFITTKKLGIAVARNRARRMMREAVRALQPRWLGSRDVVLVGYDALGAAGVKTQDVLKELTWLAEREKLLGETPATAAGI